MATLRLLLTISVSLFGVWAQGQFPYLTQWVLIYLSVFVVSWYGGMFHGVFSTIFSLSVAAVYLITPEKLSTSSIIELLILSGLGLWISFSMDQYKKSRKKLTASEQLLKSLGFLDKLLDNLPLMVFVKDAEELRLIKFNKYGLDLLGHDFSELEGKNDFDIFPREQAEHFIARDREVLNSKKMLDIPSEAAMTKSAGLRILHTKKIPILDSKGKPLYLLGVSEDITDAVEEEKRKTKILADESARMERLRIQESETFIAKIISELSTTLDYNETLHRLVTIVGPSLGDWATLIVRNEEGEFRRAACFHVNPSLAPLLLELVNNHVPSSRDKEILSALEKGEGQLLREKEFEAFFARTVDPRKVEIFRALGTASSIVIPIKFRDRVLGSLNIARGSERPSFDELDLLLGEEIGRRAGAILENSLLFKATQKAVMARDEFLSIASHELKTPITSLKMQLQMLQRAKGNEGSFKQLQNAVKQVDRLTVLVNDLLEVSKIESGRMNYNFQKFPIGELVSGVVENLRNDFISKNAELSLRIMQESEIMGDSYRLEQVIVNLLTNALKYGNEKPVSLTVEATTDEAIVTVKDQGQGIPEESLGKIFEKFDRGRQDTTISGLGLGLFISNQIVKAHRGRIEVKSQKDAGSEFRLHIPRQSEGSRAGPTSSPEI